MAVLRVRFARGPAARWLTPQEFLSAIRDAAERANLPVAREHGPRAELRSAERRCARMRITPGPPLTPGWESRCEYVDFELCRPITGWEFRQRLSAELPDGVEILWQRRLPPRSPHLRASVAAFTYTVSGEFDPQKAEAFLRAESRPMTRLRKNRQRTLDLRRSLARLDVAPGRLTMVIRVREEGTPKPEEVIEAVFGTPREDAIRLPIERTAITFSPMPWPGAEMEKL